MSKIMGIRVAIVIAFAFVALAVSGHIALFLAQLVGRPQDYAIANVVIFIAIEMVAWRASGAIFEQEK